MFKCNVVVNVLGRIVPGHSWGWNKLCSKARQLFMFQGPAKFLKVILEVAMIYVLGPGKMFQVCYFLMPFLLMAELYFEALIPIFILNLFYWQQLRSSWWIMARVLLLAAGNLTPGGPTTFTFTPEYRGFIIKIPQKKSLNLTFRVIL